MRQVVSASPAPITEENHVENVTIDVQDTTTQVIEGSDESAVATEEKVEDGAEQVLVVESEDINKLVEEEAPAVQVEDVVAVESEVTDGPATEQVEHEVEVREVEIESASVVEENVGVYRILSITRASFDFCVLRRKRHQLSKNQPRTELLSRWKVWL